MSLKYLTLEEILRLHFQVIEDYGGSHGVRDEGRLKSVVEAPSLEVLGRKQYESIYEKASVYLRNIIGDHPFTDGNKRSALTVCAIFLARNGINIRAMQKELEDFTVSISVNQLTISEIAFWLEEKSL